MAVTCSAKVGVEQLRFLGPDRVDDIEGKPHVGALVPEHPVGAGGQPVEEALGPQEVNIGEGGEEEEPLDARRETHEVQQEGPAVVLRLETFERGERVDPPEAESRLGPYGGDVLDGRECLGALVLVGQVSIEQRQVELHVHCLFEKLPGQVEPGFGRVDVLVQVEHQVVGHDRVTGGEESNQPFDESLLGGQERGDRGRLSRRRGRPPRRSTCCGWRPGNDRRTAGSASDGA